MGWGGASPASNANVWGEPGIRTFSATPQTASVVGPTNEPTSALSATYGVRRATTPPPRDALAPDAPSGLLIPRTAPDSVKGPRVQSMPSSPSALFASLL